MIDITGKGKISANTAVALGYFDGLHLGHIEVIKEAITQKNLKSCVLTFSTETLLPKFNGYEQILTHSLKLELLEKVGVDYLFAPDFDKVRNLSPEDFFTHILINRLNAKKVICGYDFRFGKGGKGDCETLKELCVKNGIDICVVPPFSIDGKIVSSTEIRALIRSGEVKKANRLLGYELTYDLTVVHGNEIGRTINAPTINQIIPPKILVPKYGVYKSWVIIDGHSLPAITNVGVKPTVTDVGEPVMETHIIGFSGNLYGKKVRVILRDFIRPERKFNSVDELKAQIQSDIKKSLS